MTGILVKNSRTQQAMRMANLANFESGRGRTVICDFVCPTNITRLKFAADLTIWLNTIKEGRFKDTNQLFEPPSKYDILVTTYLSDDDIAQLAEKIKVTKIGHRY